MKVTPSAKEGSTEMGEEFISPRPNVFTPKPRNKCVNFLCSFGFVVTSIIVFLCLVIVAITATWASVNAVIVEDMTVRLRGKVIDGIGDLVLQKVLPIRLYADMLVTEKQTAILNSGKHNNNNYKLTF
jgi:hypothetical protein